MSASFSPPTAGIPPSDAPINLPAHYLSNFRSIFYQALDPNKVQPFLFPFCLVGSFLLPIAFLCIPQYRVATLTTGQNEKRQVRIRREWIHHLRWVVGAVIVWWNLGIVVGLPGFGGFALEENGDGERGGIWRWFTTPRKTTASACTAMAYAAGLMCGWGTIWGLETVVFGGYQGVAMRVRRRLRRSGSDIPAQGKEMANGIQDGKLVNGEPNGGFVNTNGNTNGTAAKTRGSKSEQNGLIKRGSWGPDTTDLRRRNLSISCGWDLADTGYEKKVAVSTSLPIESTKSSTKADQSQSQSPLVLGENHGANGQRWTVDETVDLDKYEYYWEPYPDRGTVWERLDWVMDMFNSFRGAGWNYSISSIPSLQPPVIPPLPESIVTSSSSSSSSSSPSTTTSQILPYFPTGIPVSFTTLPLSTPQTFHRSPTVRHFLTTRLLHITWSYLALDFFTISARLDPYFVAGPNGPLRHPTHLSDLASLSFSDSTFPPLSLASAKFLASLPPWGLNFARSLFSLSGVLGGLFLYSYVWQLTQFFVLGRMLGNESQGMNELWRYPCFFGGFVVNVLDRGLAGFWGGWWHQSFRVGFTGPARWLVKVGRVFGDINDGNVGPDEDEDGGKTRESAVTMNGTEKSPNEGEKRRRTRKQKVVAMLEMATAFFLSGVLHALGGWTSTAFRISPSSGTDLLTLETRNRLPVFFEPVGFFVSQFLGCVIQAFLTVVLRNLLTKITGQQKTWKEMPRWLERTGNGLFVLLWLHWTRWMLIDDMARSGLFLFEPVPVSVFRLLGLGGMPGEGTKEWWRLDREYVPSFWRGSKWWERGVRI